MQRRTNLGIPMVLLEAAGLNPPSRSLLAYVIYVWGNNGLQTGAIAGRSIAIDYFGQEDINVLPRYSVPIRYL